MIGYILLLGLFMIEIILFFLVKKNKAIQYRLIRNGRIITLILLLILFAVGILTFSFRYYGLIILLFLMSIIKQIQINKNKNNSLKKPYKSSIKFLVLNSLFLTLIMTPAFIFPEYEPISGSGAYQVETTSFILEDENRIETFSNQNEYRQIGVHAWYPKNSNESFPLIVYSHGGISLETSNESLFLELASHGYIVFSISHPYHSIVTKDIEGKNIWINSDYMNELNKENAKEKPGESLELYQKWMKLRTDDLSFVIDYTVLEIQESNTLPLFKNIDIRNIGIIGHSLGGSAALCMGRNRDDIKAVIALESPYMCDILDVQNDTFVINQDIYPVPVLNIYSDSTWNHLSVFPQYKQNNLMLTHDQSNVVNIHIKGTGHFSLTDLSLTSPIMTRLLNGFKSTRDSKEVLHIINKESLDFLNAYLKNELHSAS